MTNPVLIAFGANVEPLNNLFHGLTALHRHLGILAVSTVYRTAPVGDRSQPEFLNGAVWVRPGLSPWELKRLLRTIEEQHGRVRTGDRHGPRSLDLDIALMGALVLAEGEIRVPDPDILTRAFLAMPLAELAPDLIHPLVGLCLSDIAGQWSQPNPDLHLDPEATALFKAIPHSNWDTGTCPC